MLTKQQLATTSAAASEVPEGISLSKQTQSEPEKPKTFRSVMLSKRTHKQSQLAGSASSPDLIEQ